MKRWIFLLLLISCASQSPTDGIETVFNPLSLYTGVGDLDIELVKTTDEIYIYDEVVDTIKIENNMPYDIKDIKITMYGVDQKYWSSDPSMETVYFLGGRNSDSGYIGDRELISFKLENNNMPNMYNSKSYSYGYTFDFSSNNIFADADVCVGALEYFVTEATTMSQACTVDTSISYGGQGSLLNVGNIDLDVKMHTAGELQISGTLKNQGGGTVLLIKNLKGKIGTEDLTCYFKDEFRSATNIWDPDTHNDLYFECDPILFNSQPFYTNIGFEYEYIYRLVEDTNVKVIR